MLWMTVIELTKFKRASPIVFIPMKDRVFRFWVYYLPLKAAIVKDAFPIPQMDKCIDSLCKACIFSAPFANSGRWRIYINEDDCDEAEFTSHHGLCRLISLQFCLKYAPSRIQRAVDVMLLKVKWQLALVYIEDTVLSCKADSDYLSYFFQSLGYCSMPAFRWSWRNGSSSTLKCITLMRSWSPGKLAISNEPIDAICGLN